MADYLPPVVARLSMDLGDFASGVRSCYDVTIIDIDAPEGASPARTGDVDMAECLNCGGRIYRTNKYGYCTVKPECLRLYEVARGDTRHISKTACRICGELRCTTVNKAGVCRKNTCQAALKRERYKEDPSRYVEWTEANPARKMLHAARTRAKNQGVPCAITPEDIEKVWVDTCPVLGIPLHRNRGCLGPDSPSLDKIRPELGYVPGNIQVISNRANAMKHDASPEELLKFAAWVQATFGSDAQ
jgi:hypothetical protein